MYRESILCTERMKQRENLANSAKILWSKNYLKKITHCRHGGQYFLCNGELINKEIGRQKEKENTFCSSEDNSLFYATNVIIKMS